MEFADIFNQIEEYQKEMGYNFNNMLLQDRMAIFRNYILALQVEQVELLNELPWKPWRDSSKQQHGTKEIIANEWVDCLFFLVDQALCLGLSAEEVLKAFKQKMQINLARIETGYNQIREED